MTTFDTPAEHATAAASGALATDRFHTDKSPFEAVKDTPKERVDLLARAVLDAVHDTIRVHKVSYDEYNALKAWLIQVGRDGEWPLFLDVWVEPDRTRSREMKPDRGAEPPRWRRPGCRGI